MGTTQPVAGSIDVLVVDNISGQAKGVLDMLQSGGLRGMSLVVSIPSEPEGREGLPPREIDKLLSLINQYCPALVLVDVCLDDRAFETLDEKAGTWTGPAVMSEVRKGFPEQKLASYSAYASYVESLDADIAEQRRAYGVDDTPHWSIDQINASTVRKYIQ